MSKKQEEYLEWMNKAASGICPECDKPYTEHVYPEKITCLDGSTLDKVQYWEAWGTPALHRKPSLKVTFCASEVPAYKVKGHLVPWR